MKTVTGGIHSAMVVEFAVKYFAANFVTRSLLTGGKSNSALSNVSERAFTVNMRQLIALAAVENFFRINRRLNFVLMFARLLRCTQASQARLNKENLKSSSIRITRDTRKTTKGNGGIWLEGQNLINVHAHQLRNALSVAKDFLPMYSIRASNCIALGVVD
jgi:hypothetical protein